MDCNINHFTLGSFLDFVDSSLWIQLLHFVLSAQIVKMKVSVFSEILISNEHQTNYRSRRKATQS